MKNAEEEAEDADSNTYVHVQITDQGAAGTAALQKLGKYLLTLCKGAADLTRYEE